MKLKSGKTVKTREVFRSGYGTTDIVRWEILSSDTLTDDEISDVIKDRYPHAGYGTSRISRTENGTVEVVSNASCD